MNTIRDKMFDYEVPPPQGVWDELSAALDTGTASPFAKKLYDYQEVPRTTNWNSIVSSLSGEPEAKIPFLRKYRVHMKYSAAAAVFIFLAVLSSLLLSKKTVSEIPSNTVLQQQSSGTIVPLPSITQDEKEDPNFKETITSKNQPVAAVSRNSGKKNSALRQAINGIDRLSFTGDLLPRLAIRSTPINFTPHTEKYMVYSTTEGNAIRMSKKLYELFSCAENDRNCRQRIVLMQEKLAAYALTADFSGVVELLGNLKENQ